MITCRDAKQLFDRYLDGELPPSLQTELHAHALNCCSCQNELAMAETFGDVIGLDRREPSLSDSFTDRILLARRAQVRPVRRSWSRIALFVGSPMAAAASILLAFAVITPPRGHVAGVMVRNADLAKTPVVATANANAVAPVTGFVEGLLAPLVEQSRNTIDGTRRSVESLTYLLHMGLSDTNEMLVAHWESAQRIGSSTDISAEPGYNQFDLPSSTPVNPDKDSSSVPEVAKALQPL